MYQYKDYQNNPEKIMNLREIARMVDKNPGSISRVIPILVENGFVQQFKVGKVMYAYHLNSENKIVKIIIDFREKIKNCKGELKKI